MHVVTCRQDELEYGNLLLQCCREFMYATMQVRKHKEHAEWAEKKFAQLDR